MITRFLYIAIILNLFSCGTSNNKPPNVIVIISDDQGLSLIHI